MDDSAMAGKAGGHRFIFNLRELNGALGDLGTLLPLMLAAIAVAELAAVPVLAGFGVFYIASAVCYRLPIPVQPMKAVAAILLTGQLGPGALAMGGAMIGATLLALGWSGWMARLARAVPQSVLAGLQLGLGLALALVALDLMTSAPLLAAATLALLLALMFLPGAPSALLSLAAAIMLASALGIDSTAMVAGKATMFPLMSWPTLAELRHALSLVVLPQLPLTISNAVLVTALMAKDYFGPHASQVSPKRLAISSGLANLLLAPLGALPMCHGAGGLAGHYRFGARSGTAPLLLGLTLLILALLPQGLGLVLLAAIPTAALGALLLVAAGELALTRRLFDARASCWPVILVTAGVTSWADPFFGLLAGCGSELIRLCILRLFFQADTTKIVWTKIKNASEQRALPRRRPATNSDQGGRPL